MAYVEEVPPAPAQPKKKRGPPPAVKYYLVLYNVLSTLGWASVLLHAGAVVLGLAPSSAAAAAPTFTSLWGTPLPPALANALQRAAGAYGAGVGARTAVVQSAAALEVVHVLLGWVRSPLATTLMQVASRLYLVWGVTALFPETHTNPLYASMVLSWALTEVVRYSFYAFALLGHEPAPLVRLRYTLFYVLYPTGASSEAFLIFATLPRPFSLGALLGDAHALARAVLFGIWWPGLYVMYTHMIKQRRKVFGGAKKGPKAKTS